MGTAFFNAEAQDEYVSAFKKLRRAARGARLRGDPVLRAACELADANLKP